MDVAADYAHLLRSGWVDNSVLMWRDGQTWEEALAAWEPWYEAIEALAAGDAIVVGRSNGKTGGGSWVMPAVEILRPDGGDYGFGAGTASKKTWRQTILPAIERDWGDRLAAARARHPLPD